MSKIPSLTGLRFWAAAFVAIGHAVAIYAPPLTNTFDLGLIGMTLFFVLSGFVIQYNYGPALGTLGRSAIRYFIVARIARLYPLYILAMLIELAMYDPATLATFHVWGTLPFFLTLTQNWLPIHVDGKLLMWLHSGPSWSISAEFALYLLYIPLAGPISRLRSGGSILVAAGVLCVVATVVNLMRVNGWWSDPENWYGYLSPLCRAPEFLLGALCAAFLAKQPHKPGRNERIALTLLAVSSVILIVGGHLLSVLQGMSLTSKFVAFTMSWAYAPPLVVLMYYFCPHTRTEVITAGRSAGRAPAR